MKITLQNWQVVQPHRFGAGPKDYEVYCFVLKKYYQLQFSPVVVTDVTEVDCVLKQIQYEVRKQVQNCGVGTKSQ